MGQPCRFKRVETNIKEIFREKLSEIVMHYLMHVNLTLLTPNLRLQNVIKDFVPARVVLKGNHVDLSGRSHT